MKAPRERGLVYAHNPATPPVNTFPFTDSARTEVPARKPGPDGFRTF